MTINFQRILFAILISLSLLAQAEDSGNNISVFADPQGRWGATDASGATIVPFQYDHAEQVEDGYIIVGQAPKKFQKYIYGVFNAQGKQIIPLRFSHIDYYQEQKRFKVTTDASKAKSKQGVLDESGKEVIPAIYDELRRLSNSGDEPANIAKLNGKYGYINLVSGKIMIPVEYDALGISSQNTDAQGNGIVKARKDGKLGILNTDGKILLPFEFDAIGDITISGTPAERDGKLVQLNFENGGYAVSSDVAVKYSSNFVLRPMASINPALFDGLYVAEDYPTMQSAWDAWKAGTLRWVAIPSIQINGKEAYVSFKLFPKSRLPPMRNVLDVTSTPQGFTITLRANNGEDPETNKVVSTELLVFAQEKGSMVCDKCKEWNLPVRWRLLPAEKPPEFGGIGVAIRKYNADDPVVTVLEVLANGPAQKAGLKASDLITRIDGNSVAQFGNDQARDMLRGKPGSQVRLTVERNGKPLADEIVVERAVINRR
jgi:hypothetical protein